MELAQIIIYTLGIFITAVAALVFLLYVIYRLKKGQRLNHKYYDDMIKNKK